MFIPIKIADAVDMLASVPPKGRDLHMSGDPHYQPKPLKPYLGYDARVGWQVIAEWFWLQTLVEFEIIPPKHAKLLDRQLLAKLLAIRTTKVTEVERAITNHDILALLHEMRKILPRELHPYLHLGCTSYDIICTAYALQALWTFKKVVRPKMIVVAEMWRVQIAKYAMTVQSGRTHLQTALPVTAGCWLAVLRNRFRRSIEKASGLSLEIPGKFSGAVGTSALIRARFGDVDLERHALDMLALPRMPSTQLTQPEGMARFYYELTLASGALANFGDDARHLQMTEIGEVTSISSTSSAMSHKSGNPIAAENIEGMHTSVRCEDDKVTQTIGSTLQRVLTGSSVMRSHNAVIVYMFQQLTTAERIFKSFAVNEKRCNENFSNYSRLVTAELLHTSLQQEGIPHAHDFVNKEIVPRAKASGYDLGLQMDEYVKRSRSQRLRAAWASISDITKGLIRNPALYLGDAVKIAHAESSVICS